MINSHFFFCLFSCCAFWNLVPCSKRKNRFISTIRTTVYWAFWLFRSSLCPRLSLCFSLSLCFALSVHTIRGFWTPRQPRRVTSGGITQSEFYSSSKHKSPNHKETAGSKFWTQDSQQTQPNQNSQRWAFYLIFTFHLLTAHQKNFEASASGGNQDSLLRQW